MIIMISGSTPCSNGLYRTYWSIPKNTFTQIAFAQIHNFGPQFLFWREKMCKFTQIMCILRKPWSTRGLVNQRLQIHKSYLHKLQNHLTQPHLINHTLKCKFYLSVLGQLYRKQFRRVISTNGVIIAT